MTERHIISHYAGRIYRTLRHHYIIAQKTPAKPEPDTELRTRNGKIVVEVIPPPSPAEQDTCGRLLTGSYRLRDLPSILMLYAVYSFGGHLLLFGYWLGYLKGSMYFLILLAILLLLAPLEKKFFS